MFNDNKIQSKLSVVVVGGGSGFNYGPTTTCANSIRGGWRRGLNLREIPHRVTPPPTRDKHIQYVVLARVCLYFPRASKLGFA
jgi:hypothetical protein